MFDLRPYQTEALEAIDKAEAEGIRRPLVAHATGLGKTVLFSHLLAERGRYGRSLVLAHRDELIEQAANKIRIIAPELDLGIVKAERDERHAPVVVASVQSLHARRLATMLPNFATIVVDEAHHAAAPTYMRILEHFGSFDHEDGPLTLGVTATPERGDGRNLGRVWQQVVHEMSILRGIVEGWLVDVRGQVVGTDADLDSVKVSRGDFVEAALGEELERSGALTQIARAYRRYAAERVGICFTPTVRTAHALAAELVRVGIAAEALDGTTPTDERRAILRRLRSGETQVVVNCAVLTEGFDEPRVDCIVIARPTRSRPLFVQMIGRGTRKDPRKSDLLVLDVTGASQRHDLVGVASLAGVELKGRTLTEAVVDAEREQGEREEAELRLAHKTTRVDLFRSKMRWLPVLSGFCLPIGDATLVLVPGGDGEWSVVQHRGRSSTVLHDGLPLGYAQGIGEDHARRTGGSISLRDAYWLEQPPTTPQLGRLSRYGMKPESLAKIRTRGQAADLITRADARRVIRRMTGRIR